MINRTIFLFINNSTNLSAQEKNLNLPSLGDRVSGVISLEQERKLLVKDF